MERHFGGGVDQGTGLIDEVLIMIVPVDGGRNRWIPIDDIPSSIPADDGVSSRVKRQS